MSQETYLKHLTYFLFHTKVYYLRITNILNFSVRFKLYFMLQVNLTNTVNVLFLNISGGWFT